MAFFGTDANQLNDQFKEICNGLNNLSKDPITQGTGEQRNTNYNRGKKAEQNGTQRTPWVMTTTQWLSEKTPRALVWDVNPSDVTWSMPQRSMHTKNLYGTVLHVWPNTNRNTFYDEFRLHMNFQSGSIMPVFLPGSVINKKTGESRTGNGDSWIASGGLTNFYDFMQLVDAPKLTVGTEKSPARANLVTIQYNSNLFPQLTLTGMFDSNGITFTDSSQEPNQVMGWSADFIVYDSMPRLSATTLDGQQSNLSLRQLWERMKITNNPSVSHYGRAQGT